MSKQQKESWNSRFGVILAVMGSAVGLGNFLRFPGQAAQNGGGLFMIPYLVAFLIVGIPLTWSEWALGRYGGKRGHSSAPGIFRELLGRKGAYVGVLGTVMPLMIYTYYVVVEALCLYYAWSYLTGELSQLGGDTAKITGFFYDHLGANFHGQLFNTGHNEMLLFILLCFALNFTLIYRGLSKGIERFCAVAMPLLVLCAFIILIRVLTLPAPANAPEQTIRNGLGFLWNPVGEGGDIWATLANPDVWLAATGQIFFSLSLGFGLILTYASYLKKDDDVCLSSLTSAAGNGFCEVALGGMIAIPAAFVFLGPAFLGNPENISTFSLGFVALPNVFNQMPAGPLFGFLFFFLLFLAAVTSSLSMLQPSIALLEEGLGLTRKPAVAILGFVTLMGTLFITYFTGGVVALDTVDFWMANFFIFIFATLQTLAFGWVLGSKRGYEELCEGAEIQVPRWIMGVIRYVSPTYLVAIFVLWCVRSLPERWNQITNPPEGEPPVVLMSIGMIVLILGFFLMVSSTANDRWGRSETEETL